MSYKVRSRKGMVVVRKSGATDAAGTLSAVGIAGFHRPRFILTTKNPGKKFIRTMVDAETQKFKFQGKRVPQDADMSTVKPLITRARVLQRKRNKTVELTLTPGQWSDNFFARLHLGSVDQRAIRQRLRDENQGKRQTGYLRQIPHLLGASALITIGRKWLVIPNRGHTRLYDGYYHPIGGTVETPRADYPKKFRTPAEQISEEIEGETGLKGHRFLATKMNAARSKRNPPAIAFTRSLEKEDPSADFTYLVNISARNPRAYIESHFREETNGAFKLKAKPKEDEAAHFAIIPFTAEAIESFAYEHKGRITPVLHVALQAVINELRARKPNAPKR